MSDADGNVRYAITRQEDFWNAWYDVTASDGRAVATIRRSGFWWHRAVLPDGQTVEMRPQFFDERQWLRIRGMGLSIEAPEKFWPHGTLLAGNGAPLARFEYETENLDHKAMALGYGYRTSYMPHHKDDVTTRYAIGVLATGWEDVAVAVFALMRHEYLQHVSQQAHSDPFDYYSPS